MAATFKVSLVTPEQQVLNDEVTYASIPAWDGQIGLMPGRAPLLAKLGDGILRLDYEQGGSFWYFLEGGIAEMRDQQLTLLTQASVAADHVIKHDAEAELREAQARIAKTEEQVEVKRRTIHRAKSLLQLADRQKDGI